MDGQDIQALRERLALREKQLELIETIDQIRDSLTEPSAMQGSIVNYLSDVFDTELAMLFLMDEETGEPRLSAIEDRGELFRKHGMPLAMNLAQMSPPADMVINIDGDEGFPMLGLEDYPKSVNLALVSINMDEQQLGALLLARTARTFTPQDLELLRTAESHLDSAIIQCREYTRQQQQRLELETIYRIDQIRDQDLTFEEMISAVLSELSTAVHAETGYIMFKDGDGNRLKLQGSLHSDLHLLAQYYDLIEEYSSEAMQAGKLICHNEINQDVRSLICIPLILRGRHLGAFGAVNRTSKHGFNSADRQILESIASQVDTAIFERQEQRRLRETLSRSVGPGVMDWLLKRDGKDVLRGHRQMVTILYADIRGSTSLAEETEPALLVEFINDYLGTMAQVILKNEGTLDKFVGDEVMALFGAPMPQQDQALRAVQVAHKMQGAHHLLMDQWEKRGVRRSPIGIGIATDEIIVGEFGCPERTDFTVMGRAANLGARLCSAAEGGKILISQRTYEEMQATLEDEDQSIDSVENEVELKGLGTVTFYELK